MDGNCKQKKSGQIEDITAFVPPQFESLTSFQVLRCFCLRTGVQLFTQLIFKYHSYESSALTGCSRHTNYFCLIAKASLKTAHSLNLAPLLAGHIHYMCKLS